MQKFRHFWRKKISPEKVTYVPLALSHSNSWEGIGKQSFLNNVKDHKLYIYNAVIFATTTKDLSQKLFSKEQKFILLIENDIHFIHAPRKPTSSVTSTSWHMCTVLADIHCNIHAVPQNDDIKPPVSKSSDARWSNQRVPGRNWYWPPVGLFSRWTAQIFFLQLPVFNTCWIHTSQFFRYPEHLSEFQVHVIKPCKVLF